MSKRRKFDPSKRPRVPRSAPSGRTARSTHPSHAGDDGTPTLESWRRLYDLAEQIQRVAPWTAMTETEVFGVRDVDTDQAGFVSIMGMRGEHFSVAVYKGGPALAGFCRVHEFDHDNAPEELLDIPHMQVSFEDSMFLDQPDRRVLQSLGRSYRGPNAWPLFRSYRPGYLPWVLDADEARFLAVVLEQVLEVVPRAIEGEIDLYHDFSFSTPLDWFVRTPRRTEDGVVWDDAWEEVDLPEPAWVPPEIAETTLHRLGRLPERDLVLEVSFEPAPFVVHERGKRPYAPRLLLVADGASGFVVGHEVIEPQPTPEHAFALAPKLLADLLVQSELRPREVRVRRERLADIFVDAFHSIGLPIELFEDLPEVQAALDALAEGRGPV